MNIFVVVVFFSIHTLIAIMMTSVGVLYHYENSQYVDLSRDDINSVPSLTIAVGILMLLFVTGSFFIRKYYNAVGYITMTLLLLVLQLSAGINGCIQYSDRNGTFNSTLQEDIKFNIDKFCTYHNIKYISNIELIQRKFNCCGALGPDDYHSSILPISCCPVNEENKNETYCLSTDKPFKQGCASIVYDQQMHNSGMVTYTTVILSLIQIFAALYIAVKLMCFNQTSGSMEYNIFEN